MRGSVIRRLSAVACLTALMGGPGALGAAESSGQAIVLEHRAADDAVYFALAVRAQNLPAAASSRDHVILVDTSASQVGEHRDQAMGVLKGLLAALPSGHRVRIAAIDLHAEPLMEGFAAPDSAEVTAALAKLDERTPLGATNLPSGIETSVGWLDPNRSGSLVYIGDGMSTVEHLGVDRLKTTVEGLRQKHVPLHSYGVGPAINTRLLGILAQQTGGYILIDTKAEAGKVAVADQGASLADAMERPVLYVDGLDVAKNDPVKLVSERLPLRTDRETVYVGVGDIGPSAVVTVKGAVDGKAFAGELATAERDGQLSFLPAFVEQVRQNAGMTNSLAGMNFVAAVAEEYGQAVDAVVARGEAAARQKNVPMLKQALADAETLKISGPRQAPLVDAAQKLNVRPVSLITQVEEMPAEELVDPAVPAAPVVVDDLAPRGEPGAGPSLLEEREQLIRVQTERLRQQVSSTVQFARSAADATAALDELKRTLNTVRAAGDIDPEDRSRLERLLSTEILATSNRIEQDNRNRVRSFERVAQLEAQQRLVEQLTLDEERLANLIDRVRALMNQGRHGDDAAFGDAEEVARVAVNLKPNEGTATAALFNAEAALQIRRAFRLRARRADQFLEQLHQVELSHIPFPDEPPIRFPAAEVWKALTERRQRWAAVDLKSHSPNEQKILDALDQPTDIDFTETNLKDALDFIEDLHKIEIIIDDTAIMEEGIATDTPISLQLSGVSLRSALRLLLEPLTLTYVIEDEVMKITTTTKADEAYSTRVYPVGDLVVPITTPVGAGLGQGLGGTGGFNNGQGGQGGGQFGFGSNNNNGGGGGGGFFSVEDPIPALEAAKKNR